MRAKVLIGLVWGVVLLGTSAHAGPHTACEAYLQRQEELSCPRDGYLLSFGYKYCRRFAQINKEFSSGGQKTLRRIRNCLAAKLMASKNLTCSNVRARALKHHVACYVENGFCEMCFADKFTIYRSIWKELFAEDFYQASNEINDRCFWRSARAD